MPVNLMCQAVIPYASGLPTDVITNNWSFRDFSLNNDLEPAADVLNPFVQAFYDELYTAAPDYLMSPTSTWTARWYNRDSPPPRAPYVLPLRTTGMTAVSTVVPSEVSIVLSFQGFRLSGAPQARRRGRVYLGGVINAHMANSTASSPPTINAARYSQIADAATALRDAVQGAGDYNWTVWSPTNNSYVDVLDGWIDNAPDTQRRRGVDSTVRYIWPD